MPTTSSLTASRFARLRRLVAAAGLACVAVASAATPARADGHRSATLAPSAAARAKTSKRKSTASAPTDARQQRTTARERAHARAVAASARTHKALSHAPASRLASSHSRAVNLGAAAKAERLRDSVVRVARAQIGVPYVLGGNSPGDGFDCSGLVKYVMAKLHVSLPRTAAEQAQVGKRVARDPSVLRPGDLVTFAEAGQDVSHIGIYVGGGRMVHASTAAGQVIETKLVRAPAPLIKPWRGVRRVVAVADTPPERGKH